MEEEKTFNCDNINNLNCNRCPLNHIKNNMMQSNHCTYIDLLLELLNIIDRNNCRSMKWNIEDFQYIISKYGRGED